MWLLPQLAIIEGLSKRHPRTSALEIRECPVHITPALCSLASLAYTANRLAAFYITRLHSESPRCILYHSLETFRAVYLFSYKFINRNHPKRRKIQRPQGPLSTPAPLLRTNSAPSLLRHYTFILTRPHSALPILRHLHIYRHLPIPRILRPPQTMTT
jgi:hypothetical protein